MQGRLYVCMNAYESMREEKGERQLKKWSGFVLECIDMIPRDNRLVFKLCVFYYFALRASAS